MKFAQLFVLVFLVSADLYSQFNDGVRLDQIVGTSSPEFGFSVPSESPVERVVLVISYLEGDPAIELVSPNGQIVSLKNNVQLEVLRLERRIILGLLSPEPGLWKVRLLNSLGTGTYEVRFLSKPILPTITLDGPVEPRTSLGEKVMVSGFVAPLVPNLQAQIYLSTNKTGFSNAPLAEGPIGTDGKFNFEIPTRTLPNGEYYVRVKAGSKSGVELATTSSGSYFLNRQVTILPAQEILVAPIDETSVWLSFSDPNGSHIKGYNLYSQMDDTPPTLRLIIGRTSMTLTALKPGARYRFWLEAIHSDGTVGPKTNPVFFTVGEKANIQTVPLSLVNQELKITAVSDKDVPITLQLAGPVNSLGGAFDLVGIALDNLPPDSNINWQQENWHLPSSKTIAGKLIIGAQTPAGSYQLKGQVFNIGQRSNKVPFSIFLEVLPPALVVEKIYPELGEKEQNITIFGSGIQTGAQLFLDDIEQVITSINSTELQFKSPRLAAGNHELRIINPGGQEFKKSILIKSLSEKYLGLKTLSKVKPGKNAKFVFKALNSLSFDLSGNFTGLPQGWQGSIESKVLGSQRFLFLKVAVPGNAKLGKYELKFKPKDSEPLSLNLEVLGTDNQIIFSGLSSTSVLPGEIFWVWGDNFGSNPGKLTGGFSGYQVLSWSEDEIEIKSPTISGMDNFLVQTANGIQSQSKKIFIKDFGFSIKIPELQNIDPLEKKTFDLKISGLSHPISFEAQSSSEELKVTLSKDEALPGEALTLTIHASEKIQDGDYRIVISGSGGGYEASSSAYIRVDKALDFGPKRIPVFTTNTLIDFSFLPVNPRGKYTFKILDGQIPDGLIISSEGKISGKVAKPQSAGFTLEIRDEAGRAISKTLRLMVNDPVWRGTTFPSSDSSIPSTGVLGWMTQITGDVKEILCAENQVALVSKDGVKIINLLDGKPVGTLPVGPKEIAFFGGHWITLSSNKQLQAWDSNWGKEIWSRKGVDNFRIYEDALWLTSGDNGFLVDPIHGNLEFTATGKIPGILGISQTGVFGFNSKGLFEWSEKDNWLSLWASAQDIVKTYTDLYGHVVLSKKGDVTVLDPTGKPLAQGVYPGTIEIVLGQFYVALIGERQVTALDRQTFKELCNFSLPEKTTKVFGAKDRLFIAFSKGFQVLNLYSGKMVWDFVGPVLTAGIHNGQVLIATTDGKIRSYGGLENIEGPFVKLNVDPPTGSNGWYIQSPKLNFIAYDKETKVNEILVKQGAGEFKPFESGQFLPDGKYSISYYGRDTHGLQNDPQNQYFMIDTSAPEIEWILPKGFTEISKVPVSVSWKFQDPQTGFDNAYYRLNGGPWNSIRQEEPVTITDEGIFQVEVKARNRAGLWSVEFGKTIVVDYSPPKPRAIIRHYDNATDAIVLGGEDLGSGIDIIEFKGEEEVLQAYTSPVILPSGKGLSYRVKDRAGRYSEWVNLVNLNSQTNTWLGPGGISIKSGDRVGQYNISSFSSAGNYFLLPMPISNDETTIGGEVEVILWSPIPFPTQMSQWETSEQIVRLTQNGKPVSGFSLKRRLTTGENIRLLDSGSFPKGTVIFYKPTPLENLSLVSPSPANELFVEQSIRWTVSGRGKGGLQVSIRRDNSPWEDVPLSSLYKLPFSEKSYRLEVRLLETGAQSNSSSTSVFMVKNGSKISWDPMPSGTLIFTGQKFKISPKIFDVQSRPIASGSIQVGIKWNGKQEKIPVTGILEFNNPGILDGTADSGSSRLEGQWKVYGQEGFVAVLNDGDFQGSVGDFMKWSQSILPGEYLIDLDLEVPLGTTLGHLKIGLSSIPVQGKSKVKQSVTIRTFVVENTLELVLPPHVKAKRIWIRKG